MLAIFLIYDFVVRMVADEFLATAHTTEARGVYAVIQAFRAAFKTSEGFLRYRLDLDRFGLVHTHRTFR